MSGVLYGVSGLYDFQTYDWVAGTQ